MYKKQVDQKFADLDESFFKMAYLAEMHEWDNRNHLRRIQEYTQSIGRSLKLSKEEVVSLSIASQLHDVGKIMTPATLLKKTDDLTFDEWAIIEKHTLQGAQILESENSFILKTASIIAYTHHERWDGSGYPRHLTGQEIPLSGRICALADVFDALTTKRLYKEKETIADEEALRLIKENSGILFDPDVVKAFEISFLEIRKAKMGLE
jgi:putative two-component system response regulator